LSQGDSGGAIFIKDGAVWKLAGINFAVDGPFYMQPDVSMRFNAALFDTRGFYDSDEQNPPTFTLITGANPVPTGFYGSRIASELAWICSVIANPHVGREGNCLTLTYDKLDVPATEVAYAVEQSPDLVSWSDATTQDEVVSTTGDLQTIKAKIDIETATNLFLRLRTTRP
jgi:hypothetical protein